MLICYCDTKVALYSLQDIVINDITVMYMCIKDTALSLRQP